MLADRLMQLAGDFPQYEQQYAEYDRYLPQALVETEKAADDFGRTFAERHCNDAMHYFVGAGNQYGSTYSYAMCYWEEQHWLRSKSIHAAEFFHGTLEVVDKDTPVTLFMGEDAAVGACEELPAPGLRQLHHYRRCRLPPHRHQPCVPGRHFPSGDPRRHPAH